MARPNVFLTDTRLWHPGEGWRVFPAGETDPGNAWSEKEGGDTPGAKTVAEAGKDLILAQEQIATLQEALANKDASMDLLARERDEAVGKLGGAEQACIEAEKARDQALATATEATAARDQLAAVETDLRSKLTAAEGERDAALQRAEAAESALAAAQAVDKPAKAKKGDDTGADTQAGA